MKVFKYIITLFLIIQIVDTSAGIKDRVNFLKPANENIILKDHIWENLFQEYKIVMLIIRFSRLTKLHL